MHKYKKARQLIKIVARVTKQWLSFVAGSLLYQYVCRAKFKLSMSIYSLIPANGALGPPCSLRAFQWYGKRDNEYDEQGSRGRTRHIRGSWRDRRYLPVDWLPDMSATWRGGGCLGAYECIFRVWGDNGDKAKHLADVLPHALWTFS